MAGWQRQQDATAGASRASAASTAAGSGTGLCAWHGSAQRTCRSTPRTYVTCMSYASDQLPLLDLIQVLKAEAIDRRSNAPSLFPHIALSHGVADAGTAREGLRRQLLRASTTKSTNRLGLDGRTWVFLGCRTLNCKCCGNNSHLISVHQAIDRVAPVMQASLLSWCAAAWKTSWSSGVSLLHFAVHKV